MLASRVINGPDFVFLNEQKIDAIRFKKLDLHHMVVNSGK